MAGSVPARFAPAQRKEGSPMGLAKSVIVYTAVLVGAYLALSHATAGGQLLSAGGNAYNGAVKVLQGR